ncbi:MAG: hypothetical protein U5R49_04615 [Deltaproteobacteria bacterium]|nr:hypothetical protein [Deltaproteobacteria bacterium]
MKTSIGFACIAMLSLAVVGCAGHGTSPKGKEIPIENASVKLVEDVHASNFKYKLIKTDELKKWYDEGRQFTIISTLPIEEDELYGTLPGASQRRAAHDRGRTYRGISG